MQIINVEQGSEEWIKARLGVVTASEFKAVMTKPQGKNKVSKVAEAYMMRLIAERMTGKSRIIKAKSLEWGKQYEDMARLEYQFLTDKKLQEVGFVRYNDYIGASPDFLDFNKGGGEIKCPENPSNHIKTVYKNEVPDEHTPQIQGGMWVCECDQWDFISFDPRLENKSRMFIKTVYRDEPYIKKLSQNVIEFSERMMEAYERMV